ncbi:histidine kinase [Actinoplanes sp. NPDC026670]|uniref:sensor histidine kinase n=1 Tax=Actinoplanes sp. NPDC026670 TaxID=3154700 RepID=UPI0033D632C8
MDGPVEWLRHAVTRQFEPGVTARTGQLAVDSGIAVLAFVVSLLPLTADTAPVWAYAVLAGNTLPLVLRRQSPLLANLLIAPSAVIFGLAGWPSPLVPVGPLIALHAISAYGRRAHSYAFLGLALFAAPAVLMLRSADYEPYEWLNIALAAVVAWLAGTLTTARRRETAQFAERMATERALRKAESERATAEAERATAEAERAAAEERNRIARDMHDVLGHSVAVMVLLAEGAAARAEAGHADPGTLDLIASTGRRTMAELRAALGPLRSPTSPARTPMVEEPAPGSSGIRGLVESLRAAGAVVELRDGLGAPLVGVVGEAAYRIVQEALTNAVKHAPGETVTVDMAEGDGGPRIRVGNHLGDAAGPISEGQGLRNMRERAASVGGRVEHGPDGGRWLVTLQLTRGYEE